MRATSHLFRTGFEQYCRDLKGLRGKSARYLGDTVKYPTGDQLEAHIKQRTMIPHQGPSKNLRSPAIQALIPKIGLEISGPDLKPNDPDPVLGPAPRFPTPKSWDPTQSWGIS